MPRKCVIYKHKYRQAIGVPLLHWSVWYICVVIHICVGLRRCSFRLAGPFLGASEREASDSIGLHAFLYTSLGKEAPFQKITHNSLDYEKNIHSNKLDVMFDCRIVLRW